MCNGGESISRGDTVSPVQCYIVKLHADPATCNTHISNRLVPVLNLLLLEISLPETYLKNEQNSLENLSPVCRNKGHYFLSKWTI